MTDAAALLRGTRTVLLVDWPSRDVPDTLARHGFTVVSSDGPDEFNAYEVEGSSVHVRDVGKLSRQSDLVYSHRPIEELPEIVKIARTVGAEAVWLQSGLDATGAKDPRGCWMSRAESDRARAIVEAAGLTYVEAPYIADAARALRVAG
jgi:predicted CoA-binding protein